MNPVKNYQNALQQYIQKDSLQNFAVLESITQAERDAEFANLANQQQLMDLSAKVITILNNKIQTEARPAIKKRYQDQKERVQSLVVAAQKANAAAQIVLFSKAPAQNQVVVRQATKPVVQQPVAKPVAPQPAVKPVAKQPAVKPAAQKTAHIANDFPVFAGKAPLDLFYFERGSNKKLYFCVVFTPGDMKARDLLIKGKVIKINEHKNVMKNGCYYTKNTNRQLELLRIAGKNKAITDEQKMVIRNLIDRG